MYTKLYCMLEAMQHEPDPQVSQMANDIISFISNQVTKVLL